MCIDANIRKFCFSDSSTNYYKNFDYVNFLQLRSNGLLPERFAAIEAAVSCCKFIFSTLIKQ